MLTPHQACRIAARLVLARDELVAKSEALECPNREMIANAARDPAIAATASLILLELPPRELCAVLAQLIRRARNRRASFVHGFRDGI